jgi:hypothetical protein
MPKIDERLIAKLEGLIKGHREVADRRNEHGQLLATEDRAACRGWMTTAFATVENIYAS